MLNGYGAKTGFDPAEVREARELRWEARLSEAPKDLGKVAGVIQQEPKAAPWKTSIAAVLKEGLTSTNGWIARRLAMGTEFSVSRYGMELQGGNRPPAAEIHRRPTANMM